MCRLSPVLSTALQRATLASSCVVRFPAASTT
jgi:hypothetical protein